MEILGTDLCYRALLVEAIRAAIFKELDIRSLKLVVQVSRSWAGTAVRQLGVGGEIVAYTTWPAQAK
jgi:hypothetical protein